MEFSSSPLLTSYESSSNADDNYKLVPWLNWEEWDFVRISLFSSSSHSIAKAFRRIATWRSRGCLPVAIEVTAAFVEIQQKDPYFNGELSKGALDSEELLAMLYSMAVTRLVNCILEKIRRKNLRKGSRLSINEAASIVGMPRMLVDTRHEGAHRELPSLHLLRRASTKALNWLKSYYWDRQKDVVPYQSGRSANVRKEIRSRLRELAFSLKLKRSSGASSTGNKGKRAKHPEQLIGAAVPVRNKLFSLVACKFQPSKYAGSKKQSLKTLKKLVRLYSFFSSDVVSVLLEFLLKASNLKDSLIPLELFKINLSLEVVQDAFNEWKPVIVKFSQSEPDLLLSLLKAVLDLIESRKTSRDDFGSGSFSLSQYDLEAQQICILSSLFTWLVLVLKGLNTSPEDSQGNQTDSDCCIPRSALIEVVKNCLRIADPENHELLGSALLMAKMVGSSHLNERIQKLSLLTSLCSQHSQDDPSDLNSEELINQEKYIRQAAEKLEMVKRRKLGSASSLSRTTDEEDGNIWTLAKSWNPCPIGMLPRAVGSSGYLPVLDYSNGNETKTSLPSIDNEEYGFGNETKTSLPSTDEKECPEPNHCHKRNFQCDVEAMDNSNHKRMRMTEDVDPAIPDDMNVVPMSEADGVKGRLLIGGVYQKVGDQETQEIISRIRVLVATKSLYK